MKGMGGLVADLAFAMFAVEKAGGLAASVAFTFRNFTFDIFIF